MTPPVGARDAAAGEGRAARRRQWARARVASAEDWALRMLDVVPGLRRLVNELVRVEFIDRSMVVAAQALLSLLPLMVIVAAFMPEQVGAFVEDRFEAVTGVGTALEDAVGGAQVRAETGFAGLAITLLSATSFARAVQRMYERCWELPHRGGMAGNSRAFLWLLGWLVTLQLLGLLGTFLKGGPLELVAVTTKVAAGFAVWWVTAYALLAGRVPWGRLAPGAAVTGVVQVAYAVGSGVVMPRYTETQTDQLGTLGLVLAVATWLIGFAFVLVVSTILGRVLVEDPRIGSFARPLRHRLAGRAGQRLDDQRE